MKFFEQFTMWNTLKRLPNSPYEDIPWREFYKYQIGSELATGEGLCAPANMHMENDWYQRGMPYYKMWPGVFDQFMSTRMDIDADYLKRPHKAFTILFPDTDDHLLNYRTSSGEWHLRSILVQDYDAEEVMNSDHFFAKEDEARYKLTHDMSDALATIFPNSKFNERQDRGVIKIRADFTPSDINNTYYTKNVDESLIPIMGDLKPPCIFVRNIEVVPGLSIEDSIGQFFDVDSSDEEGDVIPASVIEAVFRIVVGIYFISTGSQKVLEYDVLRRHLNAYRDMRDKEDEEKCKDYEKKAKNKGKLGWNVGVDRHGRHLKLPKGVTYDEAFREAGGRKHLYRHIRGGHWHTYRVGENKNKIIVKWVEDTIVKPELPIRPIK